MFAPLSPALEKRLDAQEFIDCILPICQTRPRVYNQIAKLVMECQNEADDLAQKEANVRGDVYTTPLLRSSFIMHIPVKPLSYTIADRKMDLNLVKNLNTVKRRLDVMKMIHKLKMDLEGEIQTLEQELRESERNGRRERTSMVHTYLSVLPFLIDRPNLYDQVIAHIEMVEDGTLDPSQLNAFKKVHIETHKAPSSRNEWKDAQDVHDLLSKEIWLDVQRLDEILDFLKDKSYAKVAFETMKTRAIREAKSRQKIEAERFLTRDSKLRATGGFEAIAP
jgi:hypothetical protein